MTDRLEIAAINDESTTCECCGRTDLKRTVLLVEGGAEFGRFGTECAARALKWSAARVRRELARIDRDVQAASRRARNLAAEQIRRDRQAASAPFLRRLDALGVFARDPRPTIIAGFIPPAVMEHGADALAIWEAGQAALAA